LGVFVLYFEARASEKKAKPIWLLALAAFAVVFIVLVDVYGHVSAADQMLFFASQVVYTLLPGFTLLILISPQTDLVKTLIISYMLGMGVVIGEYFLFYALGLQEHLALCLSIVAALCVLTLFLKRKRIRQIRMDVSSSMAYGVLLAALLTAVLVLTITQYNTPDVGPNDRMYLYHDMAWNVGNVSGLEMGFPIMDIHVDGFTFGYHYFSNVFAAVFKNILGFSAYTVYVKMLAIVQVLVFTGGYYLLFSLLSKNKWLVVAFAAAAILCDQVLPAHMFWYAFASPVSMGLSLGAAYYFLRFTKKMGTAGAKDGDFILFLVLLGIAVGTKTLLAAGIMAGAGLTILAQIWYKRENIKNMVVCGIMLVLTACVLFFSMIYGTYAFNSMQRAFAAIMTMNPPEYYLTALETFNRTPDLLVKLISYPIFLIEHYLVMVAAVVLTLVSLNKKNPLGKRVKFFLLSGIVVGFVAASVIYQPGMSNLFFLMGIIPLCVFALLNLANEGFTDIKNDKIEKRILAGLIAVILGFTIFNTLSSLKTERESGLPNWVGREASQPYDSISEEEYAGMLWLKNNTEKNAVFASDRQHYLLTESLADARYYYYTAFSERQCYLEGYNYISTHEKDFVTIIDERFRRMKRVFAGNEQALEELIASGVDYLVVTRFIHPEFKLAERFGSVAFENEGITIYRLN